MEIVWLTFLNSYLFSPNPNLGTLSLKILPSNLEHFQLTWNYMKLPSAKSAKWVWSFLMFLFFQVFKSHKSCLHSCSFNVFKQYFLKILSNIYNCFRRKVSLIKLLHQGQNWKSHLSGVCVFFYLENIHLSFIWPYFQDLLYILFYV